jgi:DNA-binding GntR family transcriptional regulator
VFALDLAPYQSQTLLEVAYKSLKSDITENKLVQGQKIILRELVERYGISETPIKQALNRLVSDGLVESIPRRGMRVRLIKWEELAELFEIRYMFETFFIKNILDHIKAAPQVLTQFLGVIQKHEDILKNIDKLEEYNQYYNLDEEFHNLYMRCADNRKMAQIYANLGVHRYMYYVYGKQSMEQMENGMKEHKLIYEALQSGDENELQKMVVLHIKNAKEKIFEAFQKTD